MKETWTNDLINADKNVWFIQFGLNPDNLEPIDSVNSKCAIDHTFFETEDLSGGFGTRTEISVDPDSFFGVNFYRPDETRLGVHSTCDTAYEEDEWYPGYIDSFLYAVLMDSGSYKTVSGGWWGR